MEKKMMSFQASPDIYEDLNLAASRKGVSVSEFVRSNAHKAAARVLGKTLNPQKRTAGK